jgi:hypothetical protein
MGRDWSDVVCCFDSIGEDSVALLLLLLEFCHKFVAVEWCLHSLLMPSYK